MVRALAGAGAACPEPAAGKLTRAAFDLKPIGRTTSISARLGTLLLEAGPSNSSFESGFRVAAAPKFEVASRWHLRYDHLPASGETMTDGGLPRPQGLTIFVLLINTLAFGIGVWLPTQGILDHFQAQLGDGDWGHKLIEPMVWILVSAFISFTSVAIINFHSGHKVGQFKPPEEWGKMHECARRIGRYLFTVQILAVIAMFFSFIIAISLAVALIVPSSFLSLALDQIKVVQALTFLTGPAYIFVMMVSDVVAWAAKDQVVQIKNSDSYEALTAASKAKLASNELDLSVYPWLIFVVDIPVLCALAFIFWQEQFISDDMFLMGFSAGAVATHVIVANIISIVIDYLVQNKALDGDVAMARARAVVMSLGVAVFALLIATVIVARPVKTTPQVTIATMTWAGTGPAFIGNEKGFFGPLKVDVRVLDDTRARYAALASGGAQIMITNPDQHGREHESGLPGRILWVTDISYGGDGIVARRGLTSVGELRGRSVGLTLGTASEYFLFRALQAHGLSVKDVTLREVDDKAAVAAAFQSRSLDAAVLWEPLLSGVARASGGSKIATSRDIEDSILGVMVARDEVLKDPQTVRNLLNGWMQSLDFIRSNPAEARQIMAKGFNISPSDLQVMTDGLRFADAGINASYFCTAGHGESRMARIIREAGQYWIAARRQKAVPDPGERISPQAIAYFCR
jgi:NitT/TauT family transport system substrate-binding protein